MKITLPLPPNLANSRMHWRVKNKERKAYFEACDMAALFIPVAEMAGHIYGEEIERAKVRATVYCGGQMDTDNCLARLKWPIDWMVKRHYLKGDKPSQLEWVWPIEQVIGRKQQYRVEFELTEAACPSI